MDLTFSELRCKEVINLTDGRRLGRPIDLVFDTRAHIHGLVTPAPRRGWGWRREEDLLIPWKSIVRIGEDVILVNLGGPNPPPPHPPCPGPCQSCSSPGGGPPPMPREEGY